VDRFDVVVVGAGVVGLAVARALSLTGHSVLVIERHDVPGAETSSRNSGVIHSGIYYPTGSAKARLCVRGRELLYQYCYERGVPHRRCGKLIVAQAAEVPRLESLQSTAVRNEVKSLEWLDEAGILAREPSVRAAAGLWCPDTGIVSVHELMVAFLGDLENTGGDIAFRTEFLHATPEPDGFVVEVNCDSERIKLGCQILVNSAGLAAVDLLGAIEGYPANLIPGRHFAKGNYFEFAGRSPFRHLVYPMPSDAGLGVHATLDLAGQLRFGPDVEWLEAGDGEFDYAVREERGGKFYAAIREYWPELPDASLRPSYAGIRPKLVGQGSPAADFCIEDSTRHAIPGLINLLGIESPGLTSSLAIAETVALLLRR
jgi:L-2-hydroxyglutarate oxidase LhgO